MPDRIAVIERKTSETSIRVSINLDGTGRYDIKTPLPFLTHMVEQLARHGGFDLEVDAAGDVHIDGHHTTEDLGIVIGRAVLQALGDRVGYRRVYLTTGDRQPEAEALYLSSGYIRLAEPLPAEGEVYPVAFEKTLP